MKRYVNADCIDEANRAGVILVVGFQIVFACATAPIGEHDWRGIFPTFGVTGTGNQRPHRTGGGRPLADDAFFGTSSGTFVYVRTARIGRPMTRSISTPYAGRHRNIIGYLSSARTRLLIARIIIASCWAPRHRYVAQVRQHQRSALVPTWALCRYPVGRDAIDGICIYSFAWCCRAVASARHGCRPSFLVIFAPSSS